MTELTPAEQAVVGDVPEALVAELANAFWRIEGNYNREGSGPGSRFDGQRLQFSLALFAVRECSRALRPHIAEEIANRIEARIHSFPGMANSVVDRNEAFTQAAGDARGVGRGGFDAG